ncbi:unnamed protein product [Candida verbasci]|uniref:Histone acetyltransferase type B catalytic subunit n=1 Tax=Candida verbasci TaxID=1227364 RepID=A0A9W4XLA1_9ASCO|nr:unnamed protein product [Candida verbasci]
MAESSNQITAASLQPELWTSSSNEALKLFVTNQEQAINFKPTFTYPIFGDSETIYGYKDLSIFLCFDHFTFKPFLNVKYSDKLNDPEIGDLKKIIDEFLPESTIFKDEVKWIDSIKEEKENGYKIPGDKISEFNQNDKTYSIYKINLKDVIGLELHKRLQILVLLFIEAGSYIDSSDESWNLYVIYESTEEPSIVGFTTCYNYWKYPGFEKFDKDENEIRIKISQFIILPMFQNLGLGQRFYTELYQYWYKQNDIVEIVVEDPSEEFDDMRDKADLKMLNDNVKFDFNKVEPNITKENIEKWRKELKLEKRQFSRLIELIMLYKLQNQIDDINKKDYRLFVKKRLYDKNKEGLLTMDDATRRDKLETTYRDVTEDYSRLLSQVKLNLKHTLNDEGVKVLKKQKV